MYISITRITYKKFHAFLEELENIYHFYLSDYEILAFPEHSVIVKTEHTAVSEDSLAFIKRHKNSKNSSLSNLP